MDHDLGPYRAFDPSSVRPVGGLGVTEDGKGWRRDSHAALYEFEQKQRVRKQKAEQKPKPDYNSGLRGGDDQPVVEREAQVTAERKPPVDRPVKSVASPKPRRSIRKPRKPKVAPASTPKAPRPRVPTARRPGTRDRRPERDTCETRRHPRPEAGRCLECKRQAVRDLRARRRMERP